MADDIGELTMNGWDAHITSYGTWLASAHRSPGTIRLRRHYLTLLARRVPDPWKASMDDLALFVGRPGWNAETRKSARGAIRGFYGWAMLTGRTDRDPSLGLPVVSVPPGVPRPTSNRVLSEALDGVSDRDRLMILLGALAGLRCAEIAAVRVDAIGPVLTVLGKGRRMRRVPLHPVLLEQLDAERRRRERGRFGHGYRFTVDGPSTPWLFPGKSTGHITPGAVSRVLSLALGTVWTGHSLRHKFASDVYAYLRDIETARQLLGHASVATTQRYVLAPEGAARAAVNSLRLPDLRAA